MHNPLNTEPATGEPCLAPMLAELVLYTLVRFGEAAEAHPEGRVDDATLRECCAAAVHDYHDDYPHRPLESHPSLRDALTAAVEGYLDNFVPPTGWTLREADLHLGAIVWHKPHETSELLIDVLNVERELNRDRVPPHLRQSPAVVRFCNLIDPRKSFWSSNIDEPYEVPWCEIEDPADAFRLITDLYWLPQRTAGRSR